MTAHAVVGSLHEAPTTVLCVESNPGWASRPPGTGVVRGGHDAGLAQGAADDVLVAPRRRLADHLGAVDAITLTTPRPETNMVVFTLAGERWTNEGLIGALAGEGVLIDTVGARLRAVTHLDVDREDVDRAVRTIRDLLARDPTV